MKLRIAITLISISVVAVFSACGENESNQTSTDSIADENSADTRTATPADPTSVPSTTTSPAAQVRDATSIELLDPPEPFVVSDYQNSSVLEGFLDGIGNERAVPAALSDDAEEMDPRIGLELWTEFLRNSRVVGIKGNFINTVVDYCDNTLTEHFTRKDGGWLNGINGAWSIHHTEYTEWNRPRLVNRNPTGTYRAAFLRGAYDSMPGGTLSLVEDQRLAREGLGSSGSVYRVFDHPTCTDIIPVTEFAPAQWDILGISQSKKILDFIPLDSPQLPEDELLAKWHEFFGDSAMFTNMQGGALGRIFCSDGTGITTDRFSPVNIYGLRFKWSIKNGERIAKNAVWLHQEHFDPDDPRLGHISDILFDIEAQTDPYFLVVAADVTDCSPEIGERYLESIGPPEQG